MIYKIFLNKTIIFLPKNVLLIVFFITFIHSIWALSIGWNNTLLDMHGFRQTQTAISTYYLSLGSPWLAYETPVLGYPWSIPFEFPLYQWIVALLVNTFHTSLAQTGRFVSAVFFYLCLIPIYISLACLDVSKPYRWMFLSLFLASPLYLFWSRTFMIESTALFFSLSYLASVFCYFQNGKIVFALLAIFFGVLGALIKITTFAGFLLVAMLFTFLNLQKHRQDISDPTNNPKNNIFYSLFIPFFAFVLIPYICASSWTNFADSQKLLNPMAADLTSKALTEWNFGTIDQRLSLAMVRTLGRICRDIFGNLFAAAFLLVGIPSVRKNRYLYLSSIFIFFIIILIFANLHIVHNYYQYANGIFLITAMGFCILDMIDRRGIYRFLGYSFLALLLLFQFNSYHTHWFKILNNNNTRIIETAAQIHKYTDPNDVILIYGLGWSPELPYYSQRRALMMPYLSPMKDDEPKIKTAFHNLSKYKLGAVIFCNETRKEKGDRLISAYNFQEHPVYTNSICDLHVLKTRATVSRLSR